MHGLVLGLVWHISNSSVAGNRLRSSRMLEFLAVLVLLVPCTTSWSFQDILAQPPPYGASPFRIFSWIILKGYYLSQDIAF